MGRGLIAPGVGSCDSLSGSGYGVMVARAAPYIQPPDVIMTIETSWLGKPMPRGWRTLWVPAFAGIQGVGGNEGGGLPRASLRSRPSP